MKTFWDFCAPFYDLAEKAKGQAHYAMLKAVGGIIPQGSTVIDVAAGTGTISLAIADKASHVLCTDVSEKMLNVARRKINKRGLRNITVENQSIFELSCEDNSFDVVIASQVLHLIDEPQKAAAELKRVAKSMVVLPMSFTKNLRGVTKFSVNFYRLLGFAPKVEMTPNEYKDFLLSIGFDGCEFIQMAGRIPMAVAVWKRNNDIRSASA